MRGPLFVDPLRVSTITGGGSEARMLPRPRITPVRVNLPPNQDVVRVVSSYITCRAHRRQGVFLFFFSSPLPIPAKKIVFRAEKKSVRNEAKKREEGRTRNVPSDLEYRVNSDSRSCVHWRRIEGRKRESKDCEQLWNTCDDVGIVALGLSQVPRRSIRWALNGTSSGARGIFASLHTFDRDSPRWQLASNF